jgi:hypothetical protein
MKRIFTILVCTFFAFSSFSSFAAAINAGRLTITGARNTTLSIIVDDRRYDRVTGAITLDDLSAGYHQVKVYEEKNLKRNGRRQDRARFIYSSRILIKPYHHVSIAVRPSGEVDIMEQQISQRGRDDRNGRPGYGDRDDRWNDGRPGSGRPGYQPMSDRMLQSAKEAIRREAFDKDKAIMAKQIISNNTLYTGQVKEIMQLFSFDDSKLDFAKYAYARTADKNNYFELYEMFAFRKNKEELMSYVQSSRF